MDNVVTAHASGHAMGRSNPVRYFLRHFFEMLIAMAIGMVVGGLVFWGIVGAKSGMTFDEAAQQSPVLLLVVTAIFMTVPMVAWMRFRGHEWRTFVEMAAAMVIPAIPFICLSWLDVITWPTCGLYCALTVPIMAIAMIFRRSEYSQDHRQHSTITHHVNSSP